MEKIKLELTVEEFFQFICALAKDREKHQKIVDEYENLAIGLNDPNISKIFVDIDGSNKKTHIDIIINSKAAYACKSVYYVASDEDKKRIIDVIAKSENPDVMYALAESYRETIIPMQEALLECKPSHLSATVARMFTELIDTDEKRLEEYVKKCRDGATCVHFAAFTKRGYNVDELLQIAAEEGAYDELSEVLDYNSIYDDRKLELIPILQYYLLNSGDVSALKTFHDSVSKICLAAEKPFDKELQYNAYLHYAKTDEEREAAIKKLLYNGYRILTPVTFKRYLSNMKTFNTELKWYKCRMKEDEKRRSDWRSLDSYKPTHDEYEELYTNAVLLYCKDEERRKNAARIILDNGYANINSIRKLEQNSMCYGEHYKDLKRFRNSQSVRSEELFPIDDNPQTQKSYRPNNNWQNEEDESEELPFK